MKMYVLILLRMLVLSVKLLNCLYIWTFVLFWFYISTIHL